MSQQQQNPQQTQSQQQSSQSQASQSSSSRLVIPPSAPAGLITMTQPPATATSFYKIAPSQLITFGWNMSYVLAVPTHLTVSAVCDNGNTYPVGPTDGIIPGTASSVVWDPYAYQIANPTKPLAQETYTLNIMDERGMGAARQPGFLQPYSGLKFALYTPQAYTPISSGWRCPACNNAYSMYASHPALVSILATLLVVLLSGLSILRRIPAH